MGEVTAMDEFVASARAEGVVFVLDSERTLFTLEWRGPEDRLIEDAIKENYDAILAFLLREAAEIEAKDIAVVRSILPGLADTAGVDWSQPLAAWTRDQMTSFLLVAWRLIGEAARTHDESKILKPAPFNEEIGDPIPF
jgi:hypothetical protein